MKSNESSKISNYKLYDIRQGVICLALDRVFKPWEHDRMRKRQERDRGLEDNSIKKQGLNQ